MNRRDLIQKAFLGGTTLVLAPSILASCSKEDNEGDSNNNTNNNNTGGNTVTIDLTNPTYSALNTVGGSKIVQNILVANTGNNVFIALSSVCTHSGCSVDYVHSASNVQCGCHGSVFSKTGSVVNGPAATSLQSYPISKSGNILTITL
jgi:cytochrome b6-f complex iron-sulfur subunit